jgi:hypothetical protein
MASTSEISQAIDRFVENHAWQHPPAGKLNYFAAELAIYCI